MAIPQKTVLSFGTTFNRLFIYGNIDRDLMVFEPSKAYF